MNDFLQVSSTTDNREEAERIARALVEGRLAACVQVAGPVTSVYRWQGAVEQAEEWMLTAKTSRERFAALAEKIAELHSYDCPEIIATPIVEGGDAYLAWLEEQLSESGK